LPSRLHLKRQRVHTIYMTQSSNQPKSHPFHGTHAEAHRNNAAIFARKGDTGRYLLALQNEARVSGNFAG
jgi:hypothetical protein